MSFGSMSPTSQVAPHEGAWIEICEVTLGDCSYEVAPHEGAWIEIDSLERQNEIKKVAPHEGAWIEISPNTMSESNERSRPTRARGLK